MPPHRNRSSAADRPIPYLVQTRSHEVASGSIAPPFTSVLFSETSRFDFAGGGGRMQSTTAILPRHAFRIGRVRSTGHEITLVEQDHFSLLLPRRGVIAVETRGRFWDARPGTMLMVGPGARRTMAMPDRANAYDAALMMVPIAVFNATMRRHGDFAMPCAERFATLMAVDGEAARLPALLADLAADEARHADRRHSAHVEAQLVDIIAKLCDPEAGRFGAEDASAETRVRRAEALMEERLAEPLSMAALAYELGIGPRMLQIIFQSRRGITPRQMLHRIRLRAARRRLMSTSPGLDVTSVALETGFTHLSRFAYAYRLAFGEWPRNTLARRRDE